MKKEISIVSIIILVLSVLSVPAAICSSQFHLNTKATNPGEILSFTCSKEYTTLGEPLSIVITITGKAEKKFNETITIINEFNGFVSSGGTLAWSSGNVTVSQFEITIGKLPTITKKIPWYPSVAGNHTFHGSAGSFPEKQCTVSVSFDSEGIITPSLGCPVIIAKNTSNELPFLISEERAASEAPAEILNVELLSINSTAQYHLDNQTARWQTWIKTDATMCEDEIICWYDIKSISPGFYNIFVRTTHHNYTWPHAVKIINDQPTEYTVVHLTDIHIGKYLNLINEKKELTKLITHLNMNLRPDFVIISGDSVDWYNQKSRRNAYTDLQETLLSCTAPVYMTPGNHERYGNSLIGLYSPFTNLSAYHHFFTPLSDYSFSYGEMNFIFLDSGYDISRWEIKPQIWTTTPEGSGLTNTQMYLLQNTWGNPLVNQIITMHHPAVNDKNDTGLGAIPNTFPGGNDECIASNRGQFVTYCIDNNVSLLLTGHSHENHVFTSRGQETTQPTAWPLFLQTRSSTLSKNDNGGRIIHIKNGAVISYDYVSFF